MKYKIRVKKQGGAVETREEEAPSRFEIYKKVQGEGGLVVALAEEHGFSLPPSWNISFGTGIKRQLVITLARNLSAMLNAGLSLARALSIIERQANNKRLKAIVLGIESEINKGSALHEALSKHPKVFSTLFTSMVKAGEESGKLAESLNIVATQMERADSLSRKIKGAMIYPTIVICAMIIVFVLMLMFVVPTLTATFKALNVQLPLATRIITAVSDFMVGNVPVVIIGLLIFFVGGFFFLRSPLGRRLVLSIGLHLPVIGELVQETFAARASRTLASLLGSGVPMLTALSITKEVVGAPIFATVVDEAAARVKKGDLLSAAFSEHPKLYPILMSDMISVGEETGKLADMLKQVAEFYEQDVEQKTKDLSTIIEPVLMLVIGAGVGIFAVAIIAPIYSLSSAI